MVALPSNTSCSGNLPVESDRRLLFLPTLRENLRIRANSKTVVNLTLNTLFEAIQWLPAEPRSPDESRAMIVEVDVAVFEQSAALALFRRWSCSL